MTDKVVQTVHAGFWGDWESEVEIPDGYYILGMRTRFEPFKPDQDDTALNGLRIYACKYDGTDGQWIHVHDGFWGAWGKAVGVPDDCYAIGLATRIEYPQHDGGDDTALNGIIMKYRNVHNGITGSVTVEDGKWGTWAGEATAQAGYLMTGLQVRMEHPQGDGDDTAMNGLKIISRPLNLDLAEVRAQGLFRHQSKIKSRTMPNKKPS